MYLKHLFHTWHIRETDWRSPYKSPLYSTAIHVLNSHVLLPMSFRRGVFLTQQSFRENWSVQRAISCQQFLAKFCCGNSSCMFIMHLGASKTVNFLIQSCELQSRAWFDVTRVWRPACVTSHGWSIPMVHVM